MLGVTALIMTLLSLVAAILTGNASEAASAFVTGPESAVKLAFSLTGMTVFWSGMLKVAEDAGLSEKLRRLLSPVANRLFPSSAADRETMARITENMAANVIGLGNAATPAGLAAAKRLRERGNEKDLRRFIILNTASIQLIPVTAAAVRAANGAEKPFSITLPVMVISFVSLLSGLIFLKLFEGRG